MTKAGECPLAKSEDAKVTSQVPPGLLDISGARLEVFRRLASAGPGKDVEVKDLGKAITTPASGLRRLCCRTSRRPLPASPRKDLNPAESFLGQESSEAGVP